MVEPKRGSRVIRSLVREPLVHFLLLGAGLFWLNGYLNRGDSQTDPQVIVVDRDKLMTFLQYRARAFSASDFNEVIDKLPEETLQKTIQDYVREEALYREAKALQLDKNDYVSRLRLIQQLEFTVRGFSEAATVAVAEDEVEKYYSEHRDKFYVPAQVTFTHVFLSSDRHGEKKAEVLAGKMLETLNRRHVRFDQAPGYGDRFLYHVNYVGREPEEIESHFGKPMQEAVFAAQPNDKLWRGPLKSPYGFHLVMVARNERGYLPPLADVRAKVIEDARQAKLDKQFEASLQSVVDAYKVKIQPIRKNEQMEEKAEKASS
jgi:hypothetical protein